MPRPRLPSRNAETWECSFLFDAPCDVRAVSCHGGLIVAGGDELHLLRPGAQSMASRPPPRDVGPIRVAAAEPRAPFRYAVASEDHVTVFFRSDQGDQIAGLCCACPTLPAPPATHLGWGRAGGESALYIRWGDGSVVRMKQDMSGVDTTDLPPMDALAVDDAGTLAMISTAAPAPTAYLTRDGENLDLRPLPEGWSRARDPHGKLAVAGTAVAFAAGGAVFLSRATGAPFVQVELLEGATAIALEGPASDAALFGATRRAGLTSILRVDAAGDALRVADFGSDAGPPELTGLAWDASRQILWAASPQMGLVTCTAPGAKHGKKGALS
jgi:hypothetical protein